MRGPASARAIAIAIVGLFVTTLLLPAPAFGASAPPPGWSVDGTRWDLPAPAIPQDEQRRFYDTWTSRFLDQPAFQAYLNRPGLYDDGFDGLAPEVKAALIVGLIQHWQKTLPQFGQGFWTGEPVEDQKKFEQLAAVSFAVIFAKDAFIERMRAGITQENGEMGPPSPEVDVDAGIPEFPGMSQADINTYFDALHDAKRVVTPRPSAPDLGIAPAFVPDQNIVVKAPAVPITPDDGGFASPPTDETQVAAPLVSVDGLLALLADPEMPRVVVPDPNVLLNTVAGGTYLACGSFGTGGVVCAPAAVPLGVPVLLDLDGNVLTGIAGAEVSVLLSPTVNPDYATTGFAAMLRVDRTQPSTLPLSAPLPAQVYVVYTVPGAATQVLAGFDGRDQTLGDSQSVQVTLKNIALALAGDIQVLGELTREGPGTTATLLAGFSKLDITSFPALASDPTTVAVHFDPVPSTLTTDLRFAKIGAQTIITGAVEADLSPTVTTTIDMRQGATRRVLTGLIQDMPTQLSFQVVSEAVGAVGLTYAANAPFPRFELHDVLTPNVNTPTTRTTLDAVVHGVPQSIAFSITRPFQVNYAASSRVTDATITIADRDAAGIVRSMGATVTGIPSQWSLTGSTSPIQITYSANGLIDAANALMTQRNPGGSTTLYTANVVAVPQFLRIAAAANDLTVDARTSAGASSGSAAIGSINAAYTTDGVILAGSGNFANLYQSGTITRASLGYSGLKYIHVSNSGSNMLVDVVNSAPRYFTAYANTPAAYASVTIDSIPAHVTVTSAGTVFNYNAYGATVNAIGVYFDNRAGMVMSGSVQGIPGSASIDLNLAAKSITYTASSAIGAINVDVWNGAWYGLLRLTGVPSAWTASFGNGAYSFDAYPQSIGSVRAAVTNHGSYSTLHGNHVNLYYTASPEVIDASLLMTQVQRAKYTKSAGMNTVDLRMGGGTPFTAQLSSTGSNAEKGYLYGYLSPLPSSIQASVGEKVTVTTNQNFDTYLYGEYGTQPALSATASPPFVHGVSVRDGASGAARGLKASVYLTGLPTSVSFDGRNSTFSMTNWRPVYNYIIADVDLRNFVSTPVDLYVSQSGIPNPQSVTFSMSSADIGGGAKRVKVDLVQTAGMGALYADLIYGTQHGRVTVSNIPDDIHATFTAANGASTFAWDATTQIDSVFAGFRVTTQSASFQGYVSLAQLPSDFTLTFGRASGGQGPTISYSAGASTLDVSAYTDASLFGGDLKARLSFGITNLGAATNVYVSGSGIRFTSTPATGSVYAAVWGTYNYYKSGSGIWDEGGFLEFPWEYHIGVNPVVNNLAVTLTSFSDFSLQWGVSSKLSGAYGNFALSWDSMSVYLDLYGKVQIRIDWPWPFGSSTINLVNYGTAVTIPVNVLFHKYTNHEAYWFGTSGWAICDWSLWTTVRPHPHGTSWNGVSTSAGTAEGGAWYVTPNPYGWVPSWAVDLATRYTAPDGGSVGLHFDYDC